MPSYLDLALLGIVLISALLSMVRGFTREILAIASWAAAAVAAYFLYPMVTPYLEAYIQKEQIRQIAAVAIVFFVVLILVSIVTVRVSDAILDSRVGALDRTLGFIFGAARGFLLGVVAFLFFNWLVPKAQPDWVTNARTRPLLQMVGNDLIALLPPDAENAILKRFKKVNVPDDAPADDPDSKALPQTPASPIHRSQAPLPNPTAPKGNAVSPTDKQRLDSILGKPTTTPAARP